MSIQCVSNKMPEHPLGQLFMQWDIPLSCSCSFAFLYYQYKPQHIHFQFTSQCLVKCLPYIVIASSVYLVICFLCCQSVVLLCLSYVSESQKKGCCHKKHPLVLRNCQLSTEVLHQMFQKAAEMSSKRKPLSKIPQSKPSTFSCYVTKQSYILYPFYSN